MMRTAWLVAWALGGAAVAADAEQAAVPRVSAPQDEVVVTGTPLSQTERALAACLARHCPPDEDIRATLAHAENQFVKGAYKDARHTLLASAGRNRKFAKRYPVPVSDLMRANGRVAAHLGEGDSFRVSTLDSLSALQAGLPDADPRIQAQRIEVADMFAKLGDSDQAARIYRRAARQAHDTGNPLLEGTARLRIALLDVRLAGDTRGGARDEALAELDALADDHDPNLASYALVARVVRAQFAAQAGNQAPLDAVMAELKARHLGVRPVLVYAKPIDLGNRPDEARNMQNGSDDLVLRSTTDRMPMGSYDKQWIDVSFLVKPDGSVDGATVVRQSAPTVADWDGPVLASIASRRYAPLAVQPDDPGVLRVERYTFTSFFDNTATGTRLRTRDGIGRVEMLDLTEEPAADRR